MTNKINKQFLAAILLVSIGIFIQRVHAHNKFFNAIAAPLKKIANFFTPYTTRVGHIISHSSVTFDDYMGNTEAKKYGAIICKYLQNPEQFGPDATQPKTGLVLFGKHETGKSFFIKALHGEIQKTIGNITDVKLWQIPSSSVIKEGIENIMEQARRIAPCILVIEEIDFFSLRQGDPSGKILSQFIATMSSYIELDLPVIVIATISNLEEIDRAVWCYSRLGKIICFEHPKFSEHTLFIEKELDKVAKKSEYIDIDAIAATTEGCSYQEIRSTINASLYENAGENAQ